MATNYIDLIESGLLDGTDQRDAGLLGLFSLGQQIGAASAPRFSPTSPPVDLSKAMGVYQSHMNNALKRGALARKLQKDKKLRELFETAPVDEDRAQAMAQTIYEPTYRSNLARLESTFGTDENLYAHDPLSAEDADQSLNATSAAPPIGVGGIGGSARDAAFDAVTAALPAARKMTTIPKALRGFPTNTANFISAIGQVDPELGAKTLASAYEARAGHNAPTAIRNYEFFKTLPPEDQKTFLNVKRAAQLINLNDRVVRTSGVGPQTVYKKGIPPEHKPETKSRQEEAKVTGAAQGKAGAMLISGSAEYIKEDKRLRHLKDSWRGYEELKIRRDEQVKKAIAIIDKHGRWAAGFGTVFKNIPESAALELEQALDAVRANIGFDELKAMKRASPTGGALGQVTVREIEFLQATLGSLVQTQSAETLRANLNKILERSTKTANEMQSGFKQDLNSSLLYRHRQSSASGAVGAANVWQRRALSNPRQISPPSRIDRTSRRLQPLPDNLKLQEDPLGLR